VAADIETLIRQALAHENGFDPMVRAKIYQFSRNTLKKVIASSGAVPQEVINSRNRSLEKTISKIEQEFTSEMPEPPTGNWQTTTSQNPNEPSSPISVPQSFELQPTPHQPFGQQNPIDPSPYSHNEPFDSSSQLQQFSETPAHDPLALNPEIPTPMNQGGQNQDSPFVPIPPIGEHYSQDQSEFDPPFTEQTPNYSRLMRKPFRYVIWTLAVVILVLAGWIAYMVTVNYLENRNQTNQVSTINGKFK
jgi:hypothetical protein